MLIYPKQAVVMVAELAEDWQRSMPRAEFTHFITNIDLDAPGIRALSSDLRDASHNPHRTIFACLFGADRLALDLVLGERHPVCRGLVICGLGPPLAIGLIPEPANRGMKLRLVCEVDGSPLSASTMNTLLSSFRLAGIDAQGAMLDSANPATTRVDRGIIPMTPAIERLAGSYLAELVAVALDPVFVD